MIYYIMQAYSVYKGIKTIHTILSITIQTVNVARGLAITKRYL